ncbi:MAG: ribonuclease R, partial [Pseudomonadota bacterium]
MSGLPSKADILDWVRDNPDKAAKRDLARAFGIKGADRVPFKALLREMQDEGALAGRTRRYATPGRLPPVGLFTVGPPDRDGDLYLIPKDWPQDTNPPAILHIPRKADPPLKAGDTVLAKLRPVESEDIAYEAKLIRRLSQGAPRMVGIFRQGAEGGRLVPVDKKADREWLIPHGAEGGARDGELVEAERVSRERFGLPRARVVEVLGDPSAPKALSLIAMVERGIPYDFPPAVLAEAEAAGPAPMDDREDLRDLPLITIDPADARDHDDAVAAMPDDDPANPGGHVLWIAIADVAWYVRPGSALDGEARARGNSTYFPDRVAPMLPERLSADLCSLMPGVERPCLALRLTIDAEGEKRSQRFVRGLMRSPAALSYEQAQAAADGAPDAATAPLVDTAVAPLFAAYRALARARDRRQPLELDLPERRVELADDGTVLGVTRRARLDAHRLIEEFMIQANVAAAETLEARRAALLFRVHEEPAEEKLDALRETVETVGLTLAKGQVMQTRHLNRLLAAAADSAHSDVVNLSVLRAQTQAYYAPENLGHFGLALRAYAHFTSPIRRYADLVVHRALIGALGLGEGGPPPAHRGPEGPMALREVGEHISRTERRSMEAERDTVDRYLASFLADREGAVFRARVGGVQRFGLFVALEETGADGLVPIRALGDEYFHHDPDVPALIGQDTGMVFTLGQWVTVRLVEATPVTGGLLFDMVEAEAAPGASAIARAGARRLGATGRDGGPRRRLARDRIARAKAARKTR